MTQPSTFSTSQQTFKKMNNHNNFRSKVRETAHKFDMLGKSNNSTPSPSPSHHSSAVIQLNNNHTNETVTSSISSSSDSINSEYVVNSSPLEPKRSLSNDKLTLNSTHISTAKIEIRPPIQQKPNPRHRRTPPPIPPSPRTHSKFKPDDDPIYVNSDNDLENKFENQHDHSHEIDNENEIEELESFPSYAKPIIHRREIQPPSSIQTNQNIQSKIRKNSYRSRDETSSQIQNQFKNSDVDSIGLEITEPVSRIPQRPIINGNEYFSNHRDDIQRISSFNGNYEITEIPERFGTSIPRTSHRLPPPPPPPPPPAFAKRFLQKQQQQNGLQDELQPYSPKRSISLSNFMIELAALLVIFVICMVLVLAIRENETELRTTVQLVYTYIYVVSIIWMIWCTVDIIKFRRQWMELTAGAHDHDEYMDITERHPHIMFYFPDIHNTGGLFMRIGAGLLCMGGLILTLIEVAKTIVRIGTEESTRVVSTGPYTLSVMTTRLISFVFRFLFHCVQFTFLFRYGNLVINRYHLIAKIGLIHLVVANFCTWFEAIVFETLEQLYKTPSIYSPTNGPPNVTYPIITTTATLINNTNDTSNLFGFIRERADPDSGIGSNKTTLEFINDIESTMSVYLYPCLIEYSLISLTVFFIMWRNVGNIEKRSFLRFGDRHIFTINCARASRGLLIGGIIFLSTILTLIPTYLLDDDATSVTQITGLVLLVVSLFTVCLSYFHTTKLYYDRHAHVDVFDQVLILITTIGDFAYSFFGLFASILIDETESKLPSGVEISIGILAIFQTFLQSGFIIDTLKRRTTTKQENRNKPGRETITALLLMNLAIWMHDSLSAKKLRLNPSKVSYYGASTWAIIQAFTSPLSIFYRFHSSVCLADIWQEVYHDNRNNDGTRLEGKNRTFRLATITSEHDNQH